MSDTESENGNETIFNEKEDVGTLQSIDLTGAKKKKPISEAKIKAIAKAQAARKSKAAAARELGIKKTRKKKVIEEEKEKTPKKEKKKDSLVDFNPKNLSFFNRNDDDPLLYTVREQGKVLEELNKKLNKMYQYQKIKRESKKAPEPVLKSVANIELPKNTKDREDLARLILGSKKK